MIFDTRTKNPKEGWKCYLTDLTCNFLEKHHVKRVKIENEKIHMFPKYKFPLLFEPIFISDDSILEFLVITQKKFYFASHLPGDLSGSLTSLSDLLFFIRRIYVCQPSPRHKFYYLTWAVNEKAKVTISPNALTNKIVLDNFTLIPR
jgi:hypothetical protein